MAQTTRGFDEERPESWDAAAGRHAKWQPWPETVDLGRSKLETSSKARRGAMGSSRFTEEQISQALTQAEADRFSYRYDINNSR